MPKNQPPAESGNENSKDASELRWGPSVNDESQQDNPSPHRSFHPDRYAPDADRPRKVPTMEEKRASGEGTTSDSLTTSAEDRNEKSRGMHDSGPRGKSRRPSGEKDASAFTGVDPDDSSGGDGSR
ncbi:hypothetical protein AB0912_15940 [Streptomyces sp. NPDC007084]|uniref:hypothetical protein n=1 Tax=Streptomyces sp. NPDC007084 TaxID=3154313 RepID=UPI00345460A0